MAIVATQTNPVRATPGSAPRWQELMRSAVRDARELGRVLELPPTWLDGALAAERSFPVFAPAGYIAKMERGNPHDPLLRQVLPAADELVESGLFTTDPVGDLKASPVPGLLHKYAGRVLLIATGLCAIHCRYCFRRHFPYDEGPQSRAAWTPVWQQIAADPTIAEVILSGGDPLTLADGRLQGFVEQAASIGHVRRLRVHSRLPIVIPERVTDELIAVLRGTRLTAVMVVHANHPREVCGDTAAALSRLVAAGIVTLNQTVLLRGVNDDLATLVELSERLVDVGVIPYYLHQLDRVAGAAHFEVPVARGRELIRHMRQQLPGYAVPRYVQEISGEYAKRVLE